MTKANSAVYNPSWCNAIPVVPGTSPLAKACGALYVGTAGYLEVTFQGDNEKTVAQQTKTNLTDNTITIAAHEFTTGDRVFVQSNGTFPTGLATATAYFIVSVDADTIKFSDTLAHALAGTDIIDLTGLGNGTLISVFKSTQFTAAAVGYHPLAVKRVSVAASTAAGAIVGLF